MIRGWTGEAATFFARTFLEIRAASARWSRGVIALLIGAGLVGATSVGAALFVAGAAYDVYFDRRNLPDLGPFTRFEFPTIGHVYDINGQPLIELAREYRQHHAVPRHPTDRATTRFSPRRTSASSLTTAWTTSACRV